MLVFAKFRLGIDPDKFWLLTFGQFWPMYDQIVKIDGPEKKEKKKMTKDDLAALNEAWLKKG
jgi:hypothetical protein